MNFGACKPGVCAACAVGPGPAQEKEAPLKACWQV